METFLEWLLKEERGYVPPGVLQSYEFAFKQKLKELIQRTRDPKLRDTLEDMLDCPLRDRSNNCRGFAEYIVAALIKNGVQNVNDLESSLAYVVEKMLMDRGDSGEPRTTVFGGFEERPDYVEGNPLQARFMKYLQFAVNNIARGKIPRLAKVERRPQGAVSIGLGRRKDSDANDAISPDEIAARPSGDNDFQEMIADIKMLLQRKEGAYGLPLVQFFAAMMDGARTDQQAKQFGDRPMKMMRAILKQTVEDYAQKTGNYSLLTLLKRYEDFQGNKPMSQVRRPVPVVRPVLSDQQRDYASLLSVVDRLGRPAGSGNLGSARRRWLEMAPRDPSSGHRNRMEEVLAKMVQDGVLRATRTPNGAWVYSPGPNADAHRQSPVAV